MVWFVNIIICYVATKGSDASRVQAIDNSIQRSHPVIYRILILRKLQSKSGSKINSPI